MLKIGLDIHKTIDAKPQFFAKFSQRSRANGHTIVIITGSMKTTEIENELAELGIEYDDFFSVSDFLLAKGKATHWSSPNDPWFKAEDWNRAKADYCRENQIDIHFDDSDEYGKYFTTLFVKVV
ncbi:MAG: hypothetical protein ACOC80_09630 [Petrotogales bacterium]